MALVPMDRWLNSDQFKKKESSKRTKIDRFGAFSVLTRFSCETRYTGRDHCVEAAHCRPGQGETWAELCLGSSVGPELRGSSFSLHARHWSQLLCRVCELLGLTESLVHFSPGYLDKFLRKKIKLNGSSQTWYQMKGMGKTLEKA